MGISHYPVCIAKTQYSFSADPKIYGAVNNFEFHIKDIVVNNGAEMIVAIAGEILRMPGERQSAKTGGRFAREIKSGAAGKLPAAPLL